MLRTMSWPAAALAVLASIAPCQTFERNLPDEPGLYTALDVALDAGGNTWVVGWQLRQIVKLDPNGDEVVRVGPQFRYSGTGLDTFQNPMAIEVGPFGDVYVADGSRIWRFDGQGSFLGV